MANLFREWAETPLERIVRNAVQGAQMRHNVALDTWERQQKKYIRARVAADCRGIGQQFRFLAARLAAARYGGEPEYVIAMEQLREWMDRPLPNLPLFTGEMK